MDIAIDAKLLESSLKSVNEVNNECIVDFHDEGMSIELVDPANVMMISMKLPHGEFLKYELPEGEEQLGFDLTEILDVLSLCGKGEVVNLESAGGILEFKSDSVNYTLPLLALNTMRPPAAVPNLINDTIVETNSTFFSKAIKATSKVDVHASMMCDNGTFLVYAESDGKKMEVPGKDETRVIKSAPANSMFSIDYLQSVVKGCTTGAMTLEIGNNRPLIVNTSLGNNGRIKIMLAPRIEN